MKVWMEGEVLSPGVEYGDHSGICAKMFFITSKIADNTPCGFKEKVIHDGRLIQAKFVERIRQGKDDMEIGCWKQLRFPC